MKHIAIICGAVLLAGASDAAPRKAKSQSQRNVRTVVIYTGSVDATSAERLTNLIGANLDKIIGLKLTVEPSTDDNTRYYASVTDKQLIITSGDPMDAPTEVVFNGNVGRTAAGTMFTIDGFYLIKSGGSAGAGAVSIGANQLDEAAIRLNPNIRIVTKAF